MNTSEERRPEQPTADPESQRTSAQIIPFEKPQSALQRAVQERAQEAMQRDRGKPRPEPVRWLITFAIAAIPVVLIFGAVNGLLIGMRMLNAKYAAEDAAREAAAAAAAAETSPVVQSEPGVVILQSIPPAQPQGEPADTPSTPPR